MVGPAPEPGAGPPGSVGYATFARRSVAYLIDTVVSLATFMAPYLLLLRGARDEDLWSVLAAVVLSVAVPLTYFGVLWALAARGNSPGNALLGIRLQVSSRSFGYRRVHQA